MPATSKFDSNVLKRDDDSDYLGDNAADLAVTTDYQSQLANTMSSAEPQLMQMGNFFAEIQTKRAEPKLKP